MNPNSQVYLSVESKLNAYPVPARDFDICEPQLIWCLSTCPPHVTFNSIKGFVNSYNSHRQIPLIYTGNSRHEFEIFLT